MSCSTLPSLRGTIIMLSLGIFLLEEISVRGNWRTLLTLLAMLKMHQSKIESAKRIWVGDKTCMFYCKSYFDILVDSPNVFGNLTK